MTTQICKKVFAQFLIFLFVQNIFAQQTIEIPNGTTAIEAFEYANKELSRLEYSNTVEHIGEGAFFNNNLTGRFFIGNNVKSVGPMAFARNELEEVIFPENFTWIQNYSFYYNLIESVTFPENLTTIGAGAFGYNKLIYINFPDYLYEIKDEAFANNQLQEVIIPNNVWNIGEWAFYRNELTTIELPENIKLGKGVFQFNKLTTIYIPTGIGIIPAYAFYHNRLTDIFLSESVWKIGQSAFEYNHIENIVLPKTLEIIEQRAFKNNPLTEITIGKNVSIGLAAMGIHSDKFIEAYETNKRKAGIYTYDKIKKEWTSKRDESLILQLFAGKFSAPFYGGIGLLATIIMFLFSKTNQKSKPIYSTSDEYVYAKKYSDDYLLEIYWDKEPINNVKFIILTFWNSGKKSIRQSEISKDIPITIKCKNESVRILDCSISKITRESIQLNAKLLENEIQIVLLNDESFDKDDGFKIIITYTSEYSAENDWIVDGKIFNAHKIHNVSNRGNVLERLGKLGKLRLFSYYILSFLLGVGIVWGGFRILNLFNFSPSWWHLIFMGFLISCINILFINYLEKDKYKKAKWY